MQPFFAAYWDNLQEFHQEIRKAIAGLPHQALDWSSGADANSLSILVVHLVGAERYWIGDVIAGEPSGRDREMEFKAQDVREAELIGKLDEIETYLQKTLQRFTLQTLDEKRISPRNGCEVTVGWALCHALKHTALHVGHIQMTRQRWDEQRHAPDG